MSRILIFANGKLPSLEKARDLIQEGDFIIAADGGTSHIVALGLTPNVIIGDLDSLPPNFVPVHATKIIKHPRDKNETDLELAINYAISLNPEKIIAFGALGGRMDQTLANITLLSDPQLEAFNVRIDDGVEEIFLCHEKARINGRRGDIVSLIPWGNIVTGIRTENLKWPLIKETLFPDKTRGISNEMTADEASVSIDSGLLLIVHTHSLD